MTPSAQKPRDIELKVIADESWCRFSEFLKVREQVASLERRLAGAFEQQAKDGGQIIDLNIQLAEMHLAADELLESIGLVVGMEQQRRKFITAISLIGKQP